MPRKVLLVCSVACSELEQHLVRAGCSVTKFRDGAAAVFYARHKDLDATILISTGKEMDLAETVLNLRDIKPSLQIIILTDQKNAEQEEAQTDAIAQAIPQTRILTRRELDNYLASPAWTAKPGRGTKR